MKKLGLCVRYDCNNYGSMLQILATQKVIKDAGWDYEIIRYDKKTISFMLMNVTRIFNPYFMNGKLEAINKKRKLNKHPEIKKKNQERIELIEKYRKQYIGPYSPVYKGFSNLVTGIHNYDAVMVGSDQLWTPAGIKSKFYNLLFVPEHIRKISLATSFGVSAIPESQIKLTAQYLNRIDYISVRETKGASIIKKLTGRDATVALDPTLLFTGNEWMEIFPYEKKHDEPYIFAYFLGTFESHRKAVEKFAKETNLKVITCPHMDDFVEKDITFGDEQRFDIDPVDFLNLIRGADYVCTDSFHGTVFSILNHKKFLTFNRYKEGGKESRNSRIESLTGLLGLQNRRYNFNDGSITECINQKINYSEVEVKLQVLRKNTLDFLKKSLEI